MGNKYPNIKQSWLNHWSELSCFFKYPEAIKKLIYTTNPIESLSSIIKRKTKTKGSFPTIESAFKIMYLSTQEVQNKWKNSSQEIGLNFIPNLHIFQQNYEKIYKVDERCWRVYTV